MLSQVASLFELVFKQRLSPDIFLWKYRVGEKGNFFGIHGLNSDGELISHVAAIPLEGICYGEPMLFFQFVDAMVHPDYRGHNLLTEMIHKLYRQITEACGHRAFFCYVFPGPVSSVIGQKHGWLHPIEVIRDWKLREDFSCWWLRKVYRIESHRNGKEALTFVEKAGRISTSCDFCVVRSKDFLEWRFLKNPCVQYEYHLLYKFSSLVGWFITLKSGETIRIVDYCFSYSHLLECIRVLSHYYSGSIWWIPKRLAGAVKNLFEKEETPIDLAWIGMERQPAFGSMLEKILHYTMADVDIY